MRDKSLSDDSLKLVKYRVLFVKRGYEAVLADGSSMVHDNLTPEGFVAWKISEFSRNLDKVRVPAAWGGTASERPRYPSGAVQKDIEGKKVWVINHFDDDDHKYLRVWFEVLNRTARERFEYEEDQVEVLRQIRDALPGWAAGSAPAAGGPSAPSGAAPEPSGSSPGSDSRGYYIS